MEPRKQATGGSPDAARKAAIIDALRAFVRQRPGLEFANYGDVASYRSEARRIAMDKRHAETLLAAVAENDGITSENLLRASWHAFSGRLTVTYAPQYVSGKVAIIPGHLVGYTAKVDYVPGQYFPTEYRKAVAAVLASALWYQAREEITAERAKDSQNTSYRDASPGDALRRYFRREYGRTIAGRYFS